ncbi:MAG: VWA domain-containing protein [Gemmatimonadota bacterium]
MTPGDLTLMTLAAAVFTALTLLALAMYVRRRRRVADGFADADILRQLLGGDLKATPWRRIALVAAAALALAGALLDPALARDPAPRPGPVVLLLDASGSMLVDDTGPPRLELQRTAARALIQAIPDRAIGIVAFAGSAYALTPPTRDRGALEMYLAALDPTIVTQNGSALGAAIRQGLGLLAAPDGAARGTIVLFGDGGETENPGAALAAAALAGDNDVRLYTVGVGTPMGGPVPALDLADGSLQGFLRDANGELLVSRLDEDLLRAIAARGEGIYLDARDAGTTGALREAIQGRAGEERQQGSVPPFIWLACFAFALLLLEPLEPLTGRSA